MTICCEVCQHPACWKAEIDIQRRSRQNEYGYFNIPVYYDHTLPRRYDARSECIVDVDGSLPTYKTLDLLESGFPSSTKETSSEVCEDHVPECHLPEISGGKGSQPGSRDVAKRIASFPFTDRALSAYLHKLCKRQKEVEKHETKERKDLSSGRHVVFKTLTIEDIESFGDEYTKVYTWVPGKKVQNENSEERETKEKVIALKMIDGADLPTNCALSDENKHRHKLRSQTTGLSFRRKTVHMPPLGTEDHDDYIQLLRYIDLTRLRCNKISMNNQDVRIPSPLQTARVKLYESSDENKTLRHASRPRHAVAATQQPQTTQPVDENTDQMTTTATPRAKTMYIRNGVVLSKSPILKRPERSKPTKRTPLPLTRVSVPKKAVRKLPLFDHCSSSIKKTDLPDVTMEPLTSSENTSILSMGKPSGNPSLAGDVPDLLHHAGPSSPDMVRVPASSPLSMSSEISTSPPIHRMEKGSPALYNIPSEDIINSTMEPQNNLHKEEITFFETDITLEGPEKDAVEQSDTILGRSEKEKETGDTLYLDFDGKHKLHAERSHIGTRVAPSAIMISKASRTERSDMRASRRQSPTMSLGSKGSLDGWLLDKDIITRTYDKYQSFSPFKTPHCSAHVIRNDLSRNVDTRVEASRRKILPPSLHNLDQYLPGEEDSLRTNTSFTTRCLSPSRSMFIRQQRQPPIENVPSEIMVSRFPLLPAIAKSQKSARGDLFNHKQNGTDIAYSDSPRYVEELTSFIDDDYEEEVEEVLLNKEAFSSFELCRVNNSPVDIRTDMQGTDADPQTITIGPSSQGEIPDSSVKDEKVMNALNVSNRDILRPHSNFLLLPNQGSNILILSSQHEDTPAAVADSDVVRPSDIIDHNEIIPDSPDVHVSTNILDKVGAAVETVALPSEDISATDEHITNEHMRLPDENIILNENIGIFHESLETNISGEMRGMSRLDLGMSTDFRRSASSGDSLKGFTPVSSEDNLTPRSFLTTGELVDDQCMDIGSTSPAFEIKLSEIKGELAVHTNEVNVESSQSVDDDSESVNNNTYECKVREESDLTTYSKDEVHESIEPDVEPGTDEPNQVRSNNDEASMLSSEIIDINAVEDACGTQVSETRPESESIAPNSTVRPERDNIAPDSEVRPESESVTRDSRLSSENESVTRDSRLSSENESVSRDSRLRPESESVSRGSRLGRTRNSNISFNNKDRENKASELSFRPALSSADVYSGSSYHMSNEPINSIMKDIFNTQLQEKSSLYLTPSRADDFTEGLDLDLEVEDEIVRAIDGLEEFVLDSYEDDDDN